MTVGGSQQQRLFRRAMRDGKGIMAAAIEAGIGIGEARLVANEDARNPPPPEVYELLATTPAADPEHPSPAPNSAQPENDPMARTSRKQAVVEEVHKPDFALAVRLYRQDIKPAGARVGEFAQEMSTAYKAIKKQAHIQPQAARLAFRLDDMEESKRDDFLRSFNGLLKELRIYMPTDLVDAAEGNRATGEGVVPSGERRRPQLATVRVVDGSPEAEEFDAALAEAAE